MSGCPDLDHAGALAPGGAPWRRLVEPDRGHVAVHRLGHPVAEFAVHVGAPAGCDRRAHAPQAAMARMQAAFLLYPGADMARWLYIHFMRDIP